MSILVEAVVQAGAVETTYYRAGHGAPVLLIRANANGLAQDPYFRALRAHYRVIAPQCPRDFTADWLRDVIDGLGLRDPCLVLDAALLTNQALEAGEISRVAVLHRESPGHRSICDARMPVMDLNATEAEPAIAALLQFLQSA
ncbi:MAG TPA: hypothetical protein VK864_15830 [Longimicrobiales bacterium]|nr:hypothetical protein [Longimicrobiales bacterium]